MSHAKIMLNLSISDHKSFYLYIFTQFMLYKINQSKHMQTSKYRGKTKLNTFSPNFSLRMKGLAQVKGFSRTSELLSPRQELEKRNRELSRSLT